MVIVAISAMISLSGCHEDPTYVDSYFQRQSVIEGNHLFYHNILEPPLYKGDSTSVKNKILLILTFIF